MIVDSSALLAILKDEPDARVFATALDRADVARVSAANYLESAIVVDSSGELTSSFLLDDLIARSDIVIEPVTAEQAKIARTAYQTYGRGTRHPARLNFGDCFAYALSRATGEPLLFKGNDFSHTDVRSALA